MDKLQEILRQLASFWGSLSTLKRVALVVMTATVLIGVSAVAIVGSQVQYATLYSGLEPKDGADVIQKLNEQKIPYRVESDGSTIMVPKEKVHTLRLELAGAGLPKGGHVGDELFDQSRLGSTEFEQNVNLRRALEGELARSIMSIDAVQNARVHLVMPKRRVFAAKSEGASASVVIKMRSGAQFHRKEVAAIVHLVATAVPDLTADRVTVVDTNGVTLHQPNTDDSRQADEAQRSTEEARNAELAIENRVRSLLERTAGAGSVDVRVRLELDRASRERTEEHYEPTKTAVRSEQKSEELAGSEGASVAGIPGAQTNLPDVKPTVASTQDQTVGKGLLRRSQTRNWEVDRVVEKSLLPAGNVRRLSVAVLVDGRRELKEGQTVYVPRSVEELEALRSIVRGAVGFDVERGDTLELEAMRFERPEAELSEAPVASVPNIQKYLPWAALGLVGAGLLSGLVLVVRSRRARKAQAKLAQATSAVPAELGGFPLPHQLSGSAESDALLLPGETLERAPLDPHVAVRRRSEALEIAHSDPATAAIVLREWLKTAAAANPQLQGGE